MPKAAQFLPDKGGLNKDEGVSLEVCQCSGCGLVQLSNEPVTYYRDVVRAAGISEEMKGFRKKEFGAFARKFSLKGKKVIEVGCGGGEYLSIIRQFGVKAYGLEHSKELVAYCLKNGLKVSQGFIGNSRRKLNHAPFDAFFMLNFLEHLPDPNAALRGIYDNLADDAVGLVEVPNFDMILRKKLFSEFTTDHQLYFTAQTLNTALSINGFEIIDSGAAWHEYIIFAIVRKKQKLEITHFYKYQAQLKNEIEKYIRRFKHGRVAIWGAGHQALAAISLLNLSGKIRYVIDSAPFKQGKYTPATHLPILSPEALRSDPVDAVIVMAAGYSDEVAGVMSCKFGKKIKISILRDSGLEII
jgi:SAM-dependent methyltransferase